MGVVLVGGGGAGKEGRKEGGRFAAACDRIGGWNSKVF